MASDVRVGIGLDVLEVDALTGEVRVASRDLERLGRTTRVGMAMSRAEGLSRAYPRECREHE